MQANKLRKTCYLASALCKTPVRNYSDGGFVVVVGRVGFEPTRPHGQKILSLRRLPFRHRPRSAQFYHNHSELYNTGRSGQNGQR